MAQTTKPLLYLSFDIEADGPAPGINSMLSLAFCGFVLENECTTYRKVFQWESNLKPMNDCMPDPDTMNWWNKDENKEAFEYVRQNQRDPLEAFQDLHKEILVLQQTYKIIPGAWPAAYDWQWINYYFHRLLKCNPLGFSARCISTLGWHEVKNANPGAKFDWTSYKDGAVHTHKAIDDANEQGIIWMNILIKMLKTEKLNPMPSIEPCIDSNNPLKLTPIYTLYKSFVEIGTKSIFLNWCAEGKMEEIRVYVEKDQSNSYIIDTSSRNGLYYAVWNNNYDVVKYLMTIAPDIHLLTTDSGTSIFQILVAGQKTMLLGLILDKILAHKNKEIIKDTIPLLNISRCQLLESPIDNGTQNR